MIAATARNFSVAAISDYIGGVAVAVAAYDLIWLRVTAPEKT